MFQIYGRHIQKRSIDLIAAHGLITDPKLPEDLVPQDYIIQIHPLPDKGIFSGKVSINFTVQSPTKTIALHCHPDLELVETIVRQFTRSEEEVYVVYFILLILGD